MKPAPFEYLAPTTVEEALARLAEHGWAAKVLAGGQSLVPMMNFRLAQPSVIVDINRIPDLAYIEPARDGGVRIGAMTRQSRVERDSTIASKAPMIYDAMPQVAYPAVRTRGTFGGSIAHADPSAELVAASVALGARFRIGSKDRGERWVPAEEFFVGLFTTLLEPDELLLEVHVPPMARGSGWAFLEVARRHHDFALVGVTVVAGLDKQGRANGTRLVFFSVGEGPVEAHQAAAVLQGEVPTPEVIREAAETAGNVDVDPQSDINASAEYRRHLVKVLGQRALAQAFLRAQGG
jgi:aerobic carbon-monoxide dehydrogenase medium subunit